MKMKPMLYMTLSLLALFTLAACNATDEQTVSKNKEAEPNNVSIQNKSNEQTEEDAKVQEKVKSEEIETVTENSDDEKKSTVDEEGSVAKNSDDVKKSAATEEDPQISNGDEAVQFLKEHMEEGKDENISFGTDGKLLTDNTGSYYMVQLVDVSLRGSGKTGNLGYYQVFQNGTYKEFQPSVDTDNINTMGKEEYLKKLNEMEEADRNAEVKSTTEEMIDQEDERYRKWDDELNKIYNVLQEQLPTDKMEELRETQRTWIKDRDKEAKEASLKYEGGTMQPLEAIATKATITKERCYELVAAYME